MPLSNNEKSARHRAKVNADPLARAKYLAKRRESYQQRKREGKTKTPPVAELSTARQQQLRQKWRQYQRNHREKMRNSTPQFCSFQFEISSQWQQESAPYSSSSEMDSSSTRQDTCERPVNSYSWIKQETDTEVIQWEDSNSVAASDAEQDNTQSSAISSDMIPNEGVSYSVMQTITRLQCLLESKQERIEALEKQVQDLQEDRKFLRTHIENLTGALSAHLHEGISHELRKS
ncbi:uncharacterized protein LOC127634044 isoform X1 [Xyrauchen texanus]|uniref:uncharacterized protein LOC127634044 isoform X1 n=1 Tax=Xyrauchen texanus TaxID=154827 RepID=UPI002241A9F4|nr:uncharacterized protein LOC127634044 isoform X1 [Xyrauchen texanus]